MQNNNHQRRHPRGSSPNQEIAQGFARWVGRLRSIKDAPEGQVAAQVVDQRANLRKEPIEKESRVQQQSDDEGRWHDDGGEI